MLVFLTRFTSYSFLIQPPNAIDITKYTTLIYTCAWGNITVTPYNRVGTTETYTPENALLLLGIVFSFIDAVPQV